MIYRYRVECFDKRNRRAWNDYYYKTDIIELCKSLNYLTTSYPHWEVKGVYLDDTIVPNYKNKRLFFAIEYETQRFFETYEERLIERARLNRLYSTIDRAIAEFSRS